MTHRFPDPILAALAVLRPAFSGVTFGTKPFDATKPAPLPYAAVHLDGNAPGRAGVTRTASLRVVVSHDSDAKGLALAEDLLACLRAYAGGPSVRSFGELTGPVPTTDPDTGSPLSFFTVAARLRPITL